MNEAQPSPGGRQYDVFLEALEQPTPEQRAAYLDRVCAGDTALRAAVEMLLRHHRDDDFLETPAVTPPRTPNPLSSGAEDPTRLAVVEKPGDRLGRYRLIQPIGEGGVGTVFLAEQEEPVRRRVALKVLKPGMDTQSVIARFETERQALALMDHPNIAKVFDAGTTGTGRPYFVMELVRGVRITEYCEQHRLSLHDRLCLFIQVCQAIQHAHLKGIVHRDIKPSNILVTQPDAAGPGIPKVIDFGIAKATAQRLTDKTLFTELQAFIGTPAYMSPEQAEMGGLDIDSRTDVYSLGVLLYELLTGKTPFDAQQLLASGLDAMRRTIREQEPLPPSTRLRTMPEADRLATAKRQQADPDRLAAYLKGDLDWIVLKALEKDRSRRYETANGFAADVQRFLDNEPVLARPPSARYRFRKLIRRNRLAFAAITTFAATLTVGLGLSTWQYLEKSHAYQLASDATLAQAKLRKEAETQALAARRKAYAADMNVVQQALNANNLGRAQELLNAQRPPPGQLDLRGWEWRYLWQHCQSDALFTLCQLSNEVCSLSASSDGAWVAVGDSDGGLTVWNLRERREISRHHTGGGRVQAAFSPTEPWLAFAASEGPWFPSREQHVRILNVATGEFVTDMASEGTCLRLAFSEDGSRLVTATTDDQVTSWRVPSGERLARHALPARPRFGMVQFSRDLSLAACALEGGRLTIVDLATGHPRWTVQAAEEQVTALAFSPDGKTLASGAGYVESAIRLWDTATGAQLGRLEGHRTWISSLTFLPHGEVLISTSGDQTIRFWDLTDLRSFPRMPPPLTFEPAAPPSSPALDAPRLNSANSPPPPWMPNRSPTATLRGHRLEVWCLTVLPNATTLVSGCKDGSVCVWDTTRIHREQARITLPGRVRAWRFVPDSNSIVAVDSDGRLVRWAAPDFKQPQFEWPLATGLVTVIFSPDCRLVAALLANRTLQVWDVQQHTLVREWSPEYARAFPVGFLPESNHLVTYRPGDVAFQVWDLAAGQEVPSWLSTLEPGTRTSLAFAADAPWAFLMDADGTDHLRNLATGQDTALGLELRQITQVAFAPGARYFAAVSRLGTGILVETVTARKLATLQGFLQGMHSVTFSPDAQRLAIGGDGTEAVKLWDVQSLQELLTLEGQGSMFSTIAFSPDGNLLAASNAQGLLHLWRAPSLASIEQREAATPQRR